MKVKEIMTQKIISITPETGVREAARVLVEHQISGAPVLDP